MERGTNGRDFGVTSYLPLVPRFHNASSLPISSDGTTKASNPSLFYLLSPDKEKGGKAALTPGLGADLELFVLC